MKITNKTLFWILSLSYPIYLIYVMCNMLLQHGHLCFIRGTCTEPMYGIVTEIASFLLFTLLCIAVGIALLVLLIGLHDNTIKFEINLFKRKKKDTVSILDSLNEQLTLARKYKDQEEINRIENSIKIRNL